MQLLLTLLTLKSVTAVGPIPGLSNPRAACDPQGNLRSRPAKSNTSILLNYNETIKSEYSTSQSFSSFNTLLVGVNVMKFNSQNSSENL